MLGEQGREFRVKDSKFLGVWDFSFGVESFQDSGFGVLDLG